ncbi:hypothetical protein [Nocardia sp. NPDC005825]|uniref:hypothetical protein n=1 Tax=unclassified Nocardia TaxID=2637762 RepID=UPI00340452C6
MSTTVLHPLLDAGTSAIGVGGALFGTVIAGAAATALCTRDPARRRTALQVLRLLLRRPE